MTPSQNREKKLLSTDFDRHLKDRAHEDILLYSTKMSYNVNMLPIVYIETTVISYLASRPTRDIVNASRVAITFDWWEKHRHRFNLKISTLVEDEISMGDAFAAKRRLDLVDGIESFLITDEANQLSKKLLKEHAVPKGSEEDALHIAIAATQGAHYLLTWNFKHINNAEKKRAIVNVVESCGILCPQLCSPEELGGNQDD